MKRLLLFVPFLCFAISVKAQNLVNIDTINKDKQIFNAVERIPEFPGGVSAFGEFLKNTIRYPSVDAKNNVQGKVYIAFVVEKDGSLSNFKVMRSPSETLGAETIRVLSLSPKWQPGVQGGKPVRVQFTVPVNFSLPKN